MASKIDVCNIALSNIGCLPIQSFTEDSDSARLMQLNYDRCLESLLREYPWKFATKVTTLVTAGDETHPGFDYAFVYPIDCLRLVGIFDSQLRNKREFDVRLSEDRAYKIIVTNEPSPAAKYIAKLEDASMFPSTFIEALAYKISYEINNAKTGNAQQTAEMHERFTTALQQAVHDDVMEMNQNIIYPSNYEKSRR